MSGSSMEGSSMVIESRPNGDLVKEYGRKPEAIDYLETYLERGEKITDRHPVGTMGSFNRPPTSPGIRPGTLSSPTAMAIRAWSRLGPDGVWLKAVGHQWQRPEPVQHPARPCHR